jgi:hypothetical protein
MEMDPVVVYDNPLWRGRDCCRAGQSRARSDRAIAVVGRNLVEFFPIDPLSMSSSPSVYRDFQVAMSSKPTGTYRRRECLLWGIVEAGRPELPRGRVGSGPAVRGTEDTQRCQSMEGAVDPRKCFAPACFAIQSFPVNFAGDFVLLRQVVSKVFGTLTQ